MGVDKNFIRKTKLWLNASGNYGLDPKNNDVGPKTITALNMELKKLNVLDIADALPGKKIEIKHTDWFGAPWVGSFIHLLGRYETDPKLNEALVPEWRLEGLPGFKTLAGNLRAWCSVLVNASLRKQGVKSTNNAGAASHSKWGKACQYWFGATLPIKHRGGGRHVCFFLYWIDEKKKICATLDGNRGNQFGVFRTDLSGRGDTLVPGPRWSTEVADGQSVSMEDVLAKYPFLKVGGVGSGTR